MDPLAVWGAEKSNQQARVEHAMAAYERRETDGTRWFYYRMAPSDLAVYAGREEAGDRLTLHWKGGNDANRLGSFFEKAAATLCADKCRYQVSFVTNDGLKEFAPPKGGIVPIPESLTANAGFIQFECLPNESFEKPVRPVIVVYANLDRHASNIDNLQQSIGIDLPQAALVELGADIAYVIATSSSEFFKGRRYQEEQVRRNLNEVRSDLDRRMMLG